MNEQYINSEEITKAISLLFPKGYPFEIRILEGKFVYSGYFDNAEKVVDNLSRIKLDKKQIYVVLNKVNEALMSREQSGCFKQGVSTTSDNDVISYQWLLIDLDAKRPSGVSATDEELDKAEELSISIAEYLQGLGFKAPIKALSGNGIHLLYKIDIENNQQNKELIQRCLKVLDAMFSNEFVDIDTSVFNPARICKLYGTLAQKGKNTANRPHRMSKMLSVPSEIEITNRIYLEQLATQFEMSEQEQVKRNYDESFDVASWLDRNGIKYKRAKYKSGDKYILDECPFDSNHHAPDSAVFVQSNGAIGFKCLHNSCSNYKWKDLRLKFEPDAYTKKQSKKGAAKNDPERADRSSDAPSFIYFSERGEAKVNTSLLAEYVRDNTKYMIVRDRATNSMQIYVYENGCYKLFAPDMFKGIIKKYIADYSIKILRMCHVEEAYKQLTTDLNFVSVDELNTNEDIINVQNGLLKITADAIELLPHSENILSTIQLPMSWQEEEISTPVFDMYLDKLTDSREGVKKLLIQFIAVCLSNINGYRFKKALFMYGQGDTGKSQLKALTEKLLGAENSMSIDLKELEARFGTSTIYNKRLSGSSDMSFVSIKELSTFKQLTGGDSVFAEYKGSNAFRFTYKGMLWFCMNKLTKFGGDNGRWVYERIIPIECVNVIPKEQQDKMLLDKMFAEREGILQKCVAALQEVIRNGYRFSEPEEVIQERNHYQAINSTVIAFWNDCVCENREADSTKYTTRTTYKAYINWCREQNNGYAKTEAEFRAEIEEYLGCNWSELTKHSMYGALFKDYSLTFEAFKFYG